MLCDIIKEEKWLIEVDPFLFSISQQANKTKYRTSKRGISNKEIKKSKDNRNDNSGASEITEHMT